MIQTLAWVLPRPSKSKYIGSFPLYFEKRLLDLLRLPKSAMILHPFGGKAEFGIRIDVNEEVQPDVIADAHNLPFADGLFDLVLLDPPYSDEYSERLYATKGVKFKEYTAEAVRVLKEGSYLVMYHYLATPGIQGTILVKRIFIETRVWHKLRCVHVHRKDSSAWRGIRGQAVMEL